MSPPVRVLVVDDDPLVREAPTMMLDGLEGIEVVGSAEDGDEVPEALSRHACDVVLMDLRMPRVDGAMATARLRAHRDGPQVLVLTTFDTDEEILGALRAGAVGYLLKDTPPMQIGEALHLSEATVKAHVSTILATLGVGNRTQVALLAHDAGLG